MRKAHVSSPARQSRFCRRSQPRHPLYQPYRVCSRRPIIFFFWKLKVAGVVCMRMYDMITHALHGEDRCAVCCVAIYMLL